MDRACRESALDRFNRRALKMLTSSRTREAFDLSQEPDAVRDRRAKPALGPAAGRGGRAVRADHSQLSGQQGHQPHRRNELGRSLDEFQYLAVYRQRMPQFDVAVPALIEDLYARGLDRNVVFVFCGEFGRTPKIGHQDKSKQPGRDQ